MQLDTPATIAILGAGPIGLEAALYARYLGYQVNVYERGQVADHLRQYGHVRMFTPFGQNVSPLGLAALSAQDERFEPPPSDALLTAAEFRSAYLLPLSQSDLLIDSIHEEAEVLFVGRPRYAKTQTEDPELRVDDGFRVLYRDASGDEYAATADAVIDATGVFGNPVWLGPGGTPALGERRLQKAGRKEKPSQRLLEYGLPDILGDQRKRYAGKSVLLVGVDLAAAINLLALVELARQTSPGEIFWVTPEADRPAWADEVAEPQPSRPATAEPVPRIAHDPCGERDRIAVAANAALGQKGVRHLPGCSILRIKQDGDSLEVRLLFPDDSKEDIRVDRILGNVGYRPDRGMYRELQVAECPVSEAPQNLEASPGALATGEPHFYILGAKSHGRRGGFTIERGLDQVRDLFKMLGGREGLDLYGTHRALS